MISSSRRLEGKVAIVTGGASGIGASAVELFSEHGAKVVIGDIEDDRGRALAEKLGDSVCYIHCDVSKEDEMSELIDAAIAKFGQLDIMYSNAGILGSMEGSILELQKNKVERLLGVNLVGSFMAAKHAARAMIPSKKGSIIFTASACTQIAGLASHSYAASKHGIVGLMKSLAVEMGVHGIRVNCVSPFGVLTGIDNGGGADYERKKGMFEKIMGEAANLKGRCLEAQDIAMAALFLASDEASYVSGLNLVVDGGFSVVNPSLIMAQQGCSRRV